MLATRDCQHFFIIFVVCTNVRLSKLTHTPSYPFLQMQHFDSSPGHANISSLAPMEEPTKNGFNSLFKTIKSPIFLHVQTRNSIPNIAANSNYHEGLSHIGGTINRKPIGGRYKRETDEAKSPSSKQTIYRNKTIETDPANYNNRNEQTIADTFVDSSPDLLLFNVSGFLTTDLVTNTDSEVNFNSTFFDEPCNEYADEDCVIDHMKVCVGEKQYCNLTYEEYMELLHEYITPTPSEWILIVSHGFVFIMGLVSSSH